MKKQSILNTMRKWSPKVKKPVVEKQQVVISATPEPIEYRKWLEDNQ